MFTDFPQEEEAMDETLGQKQERFARAHPRLVDKAIEIGSKWGCGVRLGDLFRDPRTNGEMGIKMGYGAANSCHKLKMAQDINFVRESAIVGDGPEHKELHDFWDGMGGSKRIAEDINHYSFDHNGFR